MDPLGIVQQFGIADDLAVLRLRSPGETSFLVVWASPAGARVARADAGAKKAAFEGKLPKGYASVRGPLDLEGAMVVGAHARGVVLALGERRERRVAITAARGRVAVVPLPDADPAAPPTEEVRAPLEGEAAAAVLSELVQGALARHVRIARDVVARARAKVARRADAVRGDLAKMAEAESIIATAQWLVAEAARAPRGAREMVVTDWSTGEPVELRVPLDPGKPARPQVEAMFKRGRRLRAGRPFAERRLAEARAREDALDRVLAALPAATDLAAVDALLAEAKAASPKDVALPGSLAAGGKKPRDEGAGRPYRTFAGAGGARVLVGKGGEKNDHLTFKIAGPHDLFVHTKGIPGAHVIVPLAKGKTCPPDLLADAALLAAHFSRAKDEAVVDVEYTQRKYLKKPRGAAPGLVVLERERVMALRAAPDRLRALLEAEEI